MLKGHRLCKFLLVLVVIIQLAVVTGCESTAPKRVLAKFLVAMVNGDLNSAKMYCTEEYVSANLAGQDYHPCPHTSYPQCFAVSDRV